MPAGVAVYPREAFVQVPAVDKTLQDPAFDLLTNTTAER